MGEPLQVRTHHDSLSEAFRLKNPFFSPITIAITVIVKKTTAGKKQDQSNVGSFTQLGGQ
jgi:hypothetical protein